MYASDADWISPANAFFGRCPIWSNASLQKVLQPADRRARITKLIGWHTFRHTYSTLHHLEMIVIDDHTSWVGQHLSIQLAAGTEPIPRPLHLAAALAGRGNLPRPAAAHAKARGQLGHACLASIVSL